MKDGASNLEERVASHDEAYRLAGALVALGEPKNAVDLMRRTIQRARSTLPEDSLALLRLLSQYGDILESTDAMAEAEYIRTEALDIVAAANATTLDAVDAFLKAGILLCKMHNCGAAVARLKEAIRRTEEVDGVGALHREILLAQAWRSPSAGTRRARGVLGGVERV